MTGTPVENRLSELWSIVDFVQPGLLNSYQWFKKVYEEPLQNELLNNRDLVRDLVTKIEPIFLRRVKDEVLKLELPEKTESIYSVELSSLQIKLYLSEIGDLKECVAKPPVLETIQKLIMICSHPRLLDKKFDLNVKSKVLLEESKKLSFTMDLLSAIERKKEKVLIFTKYKKMQLILKKVIYDIFKLNAIIINGEVAIDRVYTVDEFNNKDGFQILILSPKAAGVGLNITGANHVIHYTREWNPAIENQATDRVYRIGQNKAVQVYYPITTYDYGITVEEKLNELLLEKRQLIKAVIIPTNIQVNIKELEECL